jgi:broad specificity phosphatase PhoE
MQISGETFANTRKRAIRAVEHIRRDCPQGAILIISHEILLHYVVNRLTGNTNLDAFADFRLEPCSISEFVLDDQGNAEIIRLNDTEHLAP